MQHRASARRIAAVVFLLTASLLAASVLALPVPADFHIREAKRLTRDSGWLLTSAGLLRTDDAGATWRDITPGGLPPAAVEAAHFLDLKRGWAVVAAPSLDGPANAVVKTIDGGVSWESVALPENDDDRAAWSGVAYVFFLDARHGWVVTKHLSSSAFNFGTIFRTADGGNTWSRLGDAPIAARPRFVSPHEGWLTGGAGGDELWHSVDGGASWTRVPLSLPREAGAEVTLQEPAWTGANGVLPVWVHADAGDRLILLKTSNGGRTWSSDEPIAMGKLGARVAAIVDGDNVVLPAKPRAGGEVRTQSIQTADDFRTVAAMEFRTRDEGWIVKTSGGCVAGTCWQTDALFATDDGGATLHDITPEAGRHHVEVPELQPKRSFVVQPTAGPGVNTTVLINKAGFDRHTSPIKTDMDTIWSTGVVQFVGTYIGGENYSGTPQDGSWMQYVSTKGWGIIPIWVGPQVYGTSCPGGGCTFFSTDPATAGGQGKAEADKAIASARNRGLDRSQIIYDIEAADGYTTGTYAAATKAFTDAWTAELHANGFSSGIYSHARDTANWAPGSVNNPADEVWIVRFPCSYSTPTVCTPSPDPPSPPLNTVWGLPNLSDSLWANHQRIRQTSDGHTKCYGSVCISIDSDWADGTFATTGGSGGGSGNGTIHVRATLDGGTWSGYVGYNIDGTAGLSGAVVPNDLTMPAGGYTLTYVNGGPSNATFSGINPPQSLVLNAGSSITWTLQFTSGGVCTASVPPTPSLSGPSSANSGSSYTLNWTSGASSYDIDESTDNFNTYTRINTTASSRSFSHSVSSNTTFVYRVRARSSCGEVSNYSNTVYVTVNAGSACNVPPTPSISGPSSATSDQSYTISWTASGNSGDTYQISESADGFATANTYNVSGNSYSFSHHVSSATTLQYRVRTMSWCGYASGYSTTIAVTVNPACTTPSTPVINGPSTATNTAAYTITWSSTSPIGSYDVEETVGGVPNVFAVNGTSATFFHSPSSATTFIYRVRAWSSCGASPWSSSFTVVVMPCQPPVLGSSSASFSAAGGTGSVSYTVGLGCGFNTNSNDSFVIVTSVTATTVSYTVAPNSGGARTGSINIGGSTFIVTQTAAVPCTYQVSPTVVELPPYASSFTVNVTAPAGCSWIANSYAYFAEITGGASGSGNGTVTVSVTARPVTAMRTGAIMVAGVAVSIVQYGAVRGDFDGDGNPDLLWRNSGTGAIRIWLMRGNTGIRQIDLPAVSDSNWIIAGIGDFNADGYPDIVFRNVATGANSVWYLVGGRFVASGYLPPVSASSGYTIASVIDWNGDGYADIVWHNELSGETAIWLMNGTSIGNVVYLPVVRDTTWKLVGGGMFDSDSFVDFVWRNSVTGQVALWFMSGTTIRYSTYLGTVSDPAWVLAGVGSYNFDNVADLIWRNRNTGQNACWVTNGGAVVGIGYFASDPDPNWKIVGPR